jgi:dihydroorotate dehydrogenase (fumarate)
MSLSRANLTTTYMSLPLRSPLVVGAAAPLSEDLGTLKRLEDAGAAAIVMHSVFEEQIRRDMKELHHHLEYGTHSFAEALTYFPEPEIFHVGAEQYLEHLRQAKATLDIPIIGSLNASSVGGWVEYARHIQAAGADALELNIYWIPTDPDLSGAEVEAQYLDILLQVKAQVTIPVAVKLSPFFSNMANMAKRLVAAGADGLVLFNRFYQPDIDIEALEVRPQLLLSTPQALRLPLHWMGILYGRISTDLAATSGIQDAEDVVRLLMAGATVTMIVSALLRHGIQHLHQMEQDLATWLTEHDYESVAQLRGIMSQQNCPDPSEFERVQYMKTLQTYQPHWSIPEGAI